MVGCPFVIAAGAYHVPVSLSPAECRRKRKRYLDQQKMVKRRRYLEHPPLGSTGVASFLVLCTLHLSLNL